MEVRVFANTYGEVSVEPIRVLKQIKESLLSRGNYIRLENGKYILYESGVGNHSWDEEIGTVSKEKYEAIQNVTELLKYFNKKDDEEIILKREFEDYKKNQTSN